MYSTVGCKKLYLKDTGARLVSGAQPEICSEKEGCSAGGHWEFGAKPQALKKKFFFCWNNLIFGLFEEINAFQTWHQGELR